METLEIHQEIEFDASPHKIYELLMDTAMHSQFTGEPADISRDVGGPFSCYGDYINGENIELIPDKKIVQKWIGKDFPEGHHSTLTIVLEDKGNGKTLLILDHANVPADLAPNIKLGWTTHYWDKMKEYLSNE